jgi:hypothetical protein
MGGGLCCSFVTEKQRGNRECLLGFDQDLVVALYAGMADANHWLCDFAIRSLVFMA